MNREKIHAIALSYLSGIGPIRARRLLLQAGSFEGCFELTEEEYRQLEIPASTIDALIKKGSLAAAEREADFVERHEIEVLDLLDERFPSRLEEMPDCPFVIYTRGRGDLQPKRSIAIVGTRQPTVHGRAFCHELIEQLAGYEVTIVSGLAYGIDIAAHQACVELGVPTIGILAHGLGEIYPSAHKSVALKMLEQGALMTEYPSGMRSRKEYFPQRNRLVAGLSDAVVVIESGLTGGSMITAQLAEGYARPVFAVPGRPSDTRSEGCNMLIKSHRAELLNNADDLAYHLGWKKLSRKPRTLDQQPSLFSTFTPIEQQVVELLKKNFELDLDSLAHQGALETGKLATTLLELEFRGIVRSLPGKRYSLC